MTGCMGCHVDSTLIFATSVEAAKIIDQLLDHSELMAR